jgi:hypothetical protein
MELSPPAAQFDKETWLKLMEVRPPLRQTVSRGTGTVSFCARAPVVAIRNKKSKGIFFINMVLQTHKFKSIFLKQKDNQVTFLTRPVFK